MSDLGLRAQLPSNSFPDPEKNQPPEISDQDWELRTGRAITALQETLPEFFDKGLVTSVNKSTGLPRTSASLPAAHINFLEPYTIQDDDEPIYSSQIRLSYTPPLELPAPFPKTFHIEGIQLYLASSSFIKHTMNALYSDLNVELTKLTVSPLASSSSKKRQTRQKSILIRQNVTGLARVSAKPAEWEIESTYTFSPITGLIHQHVVNSIHPAPRLAVYDSMRSSLSKLLGFEWHGGASHNAPNGAAFKGKKPSPKSG
ncbi:hypothetical protein BJ912DRAFT_856067 [Pholiota molesta]|nr:hypothetical protein BJ912DRAFT_856067 [Pholiota molesta]